MNSLEVRQDLTTTGRRRVVLDSKKKVLNPKDLKTM
jgi:hypothetical protein